VIAALVGQLSSPEFAQREAAMRKLATFGEPARALLAEAAKEVRAKLGGEPGNNFGWHIVRA